jgi:hypothetical protein
MLHHEMQLRSWVCTSVGMCFLFVAEEEGNKEAEEDHDRKEEMYL